MKAKLAGVCVGARTAALKQSFGKTEHHDQEHTPQKGVVGKDSSNAQVRERKLLSRSNSAAAARAQSMRQREPISEVLPVSH